MGDPFESIVAACNLSSSQQHLLDQSLYTREEEEEDEPSPLHSSPEPYSGPPLFSSADGDGILIISAPGSPTSATTTPPAEEFTTPPEDPCRPIETDVDSIMVGEKRMPENRNPIEEAPSPSKKARVSEGCSSLQTEEIDEYYEECDTEEIEDYDEDDEEEEANAQRTTDSDVDTLMEVLALLAREELQHCCHESGGGVDILETAKRLGFKFPGDGGDEEIH